MVSWRKLISNAMTARGESFTDAIHWTPRDLDFDKKFDNGYGGSEGVPFTLWTHGRVYFPVVYDGAEWVESVPRHPCDEATPHLGGQ